MAKKVVEQGLYRCGNKVAWMSHAGGNFVEKVGTVVMVCKPGWVSLTTAQKVAFVKKHLKCSDNMAKNTARFMTDEQVLGDVYKLKFSLSEGWREEEHYLVEVAPPEGSLKPLLYHPLTKLLSFVSVK